MAKGHLTNGQFFQNNRFAQLCQPSDFDVVCHGKLIESSRLPETFYNGWYPVRHQCSFPDHKPRPGAGLKSERGLQFRNNRIVCEICDHPDNRLLTAREPTCWSNMAPGRNSVAPKTCEHKICETRMCPQKGLRDEPVETVKGCTHKVDAYWRYHDPHYVQGSSGMPDTCRVHGHNWFKRQMANDNKYKSDQQVYRAAQKQLLLSRADARPIPAPCSQRKPCRQYATNSAAETPPPADTVQQEVRVSLPSNKISGAILSQKPSAPGTPSGHVQEQQ
ncbi:hypothetical protein BsWGS_06273 [Bradybaena similaris]